MIHPSYKPLPSRDFLVNQLIYDPDTGLVKRRRSGKPFGSLLKTTNGPWLRARVGAEKYMVHRLIWKMMTGEDPYEVDHINRNGLDNRWENLRETAREGNCRNKSPHRGRDAPKGVTKSGTRWVARIGINYRNFNLGSFATAEEAAKAYNDAAPLFHGEFASPSR